MRSNLVQKNANHGAHSHDKFKDGSNFISEEKIKDLSAWEISQIINRLSMLQENKSMVEAKTQKTIEASSKKISELQEKLLNAKRECNAYQLELSQQMENKNIISKLQQQLEIKDNEVLIRENNCKQQINHIQTLIDLEKEDRARDRQNYTRNLNQLQKNSAYQIKRLKNQLQETQDEIETLNDNYQKKLFALEKMQNEQQVNKINKQIQINREMEHSQRQYENIIQSLKTQVEIHKEESSQLRKTLAQEQKQHQDQLAILKTNYANSNQAKQKIIIQLEHQLANAKYEIGKLQAKS